MLLNRERIGIWKFRIYIERTRRRRDLNSTLVFLFQRLRRIGVELSSHTVVFAVRVQAIRYRIGDGTSTAIGCLSVRPGVCDIRVDYGVLGGGPAPSRVRWCGDGEKFIRRITRFHCRNSIYYLYFFVRIYIVCTGNKNIPFVEMNIFLLGRVGFFFTWFLVGARR